MSIELDDAYGQDKIKLDIRVSRVVGALYVTGDRAGDDFLDGLSTDVHEIAAFFRMVDQARADFEAATGLSLDKL